MSVRKISGRLKKNNLFEILPYMIEIKPELEPKEIFGEEIIKEIPKDVMGEIFDFLGVKDKIRKVKFSIEEFTFRCHYCNAAIVESGNCYNFVFKQHLKECKCPFFSIEKMPMLYQIYKKKDRVILNNYLSGLDVEFILKKRYQYRPHLYRVDELRNELKKLRGNEPILLSTIKEMYSEWFKFKKIKNGNN